MENYVCSECGRSCYHDGRNGDGPILVCGCDKRGPRVSDGRMGSVNHYYPNAKAHPVEGDDYSSNNYDPYWNDRR